MTNLSDGASWTNIFDQVFTAEPVADKPGKFRAIPVIIVPTSLDSHTVAVEISTSNSKPSWRFGGTVFQAISVSQQSSIGSVRPSKSHPIPLAQATEFTFEKLSIYYRVGLLLPKWFEDAYVQVWSFVGSDPPLIVEERLKNIETSLVRIETKVNQ